MGNTFRHLGEPQNAMAGVLQDGRAAAIRGSVAGRREDGGAVPGVRYLAQDRLQDFRSLQGLRCGRTDRSASQTLSARQPLTVSDRDVDRAAEEGAPELG